MRWCGPFTHDVPELRPPDLFGGDVTIHGGGTTLSYLLLPVIPEERLAQQPVVHGFGIGPVYSPGMTSDHVDLILEQWTKERPDLDPFPMGVVARLLRVSLLVERQVGEVFSKFGLNQSGFTVLAALRRSGEPFRLSPTQLHNALLVSSGAMTNRIDRLEARGWVERVTDPNDRRGVLVQLTEQGHEVVDEAVEALIEAEVEILKTLTRTEQTELARLLRKLSAALESDKP